MEDNIISWNIENWITVVLMVTLGFALIAFITQLVRKSANKSMAA